ncbi:MAG: undecaprenyl-phosphate galactose phosphotransferase WbaP [Pedobacter sp.]|nr:undecaprenyl-phosphate galactose phosphotransferase WbaP [Pedobacter sp.]
MKNLVLLIVDALALCLAFALGQAMRFAGDFADQPFSAWWLQEGQFRVQATLAAALVVLIYLGWQKQHYFRRQPFWDEVAGLVKAVCIGFIVDGAFMYFNKWQFSRMAFAGQWLSLLLLLPLFRYAIKAVLLRQGWWQIPVSMIGGGANAQEAWKALQSESLMGARLAEVLLPAGQSAQDWVTVPVRTLTPGQPHSFAGNLVIVALESDEQETQDHALRSLSRSTLDVLVVPPARRLPLLGMQPLHVFSHETLFLRAENQLQRPLAAFTKRSFDIVMSLLLLLLLSPLFALLIWKVRKSGGPAFFGHGRIGHNGQPFPCYKFRTMVPNAAEVLEQLLQNDLAARQEWELEFKLRNDPRITAIGDLLRRTSLDELPQLWNVLKGDMSLVGPRPVIRDELEKYAEDVSYYLQVRPGMTGLWQVSGRNNVDYDTRVALDAWYVRNWSLWNDIVILLKTVRVVLGKEGAY